jgi:hypothetical protein
MWCRLGADVVISDGFGEGDVRCPEGAIDNACLSITSAAREDQK